MQVTFLGQISFPSKVPGFLHVLFSLVEKHSPLSFLGLNALVPLCCIHCARFDILLDSSFVCLLFFSETKCKPAQKIQGNVLVLNWKAHAKIQELLKEKNVTWKSHLRLSCTKPFIYFPSCGIQKHSNSQAQWNKTHQIGDKAKFSGEAFSKQNQHLSSLTFTRLTPGIDPVIHHICIQGIKVVLWSNFYPLSFWKYHPEFHERMKMPFTVCKYLH